MVCGPERGLLKHSRDEAMFEPIDCFTRTKVRDMINISIEEFDPGSERTLAAWLRHASRTELFLGN